MRVLVAGAGIGGLAVAFGLLGQGHDVTVVEEAPELRPGGAGISIWPNGRAALERLGLSLPVVGQRIEVLRSLRSDGSPIFDLDVIALEQRLGFETRLLRRRELVEHLVAQLPRSTIEYGKPVVSVRPGPGRQMTVECGDEARVADLVIGADGHRSAVRRFVYDTGPAKPTGLATWQGVQAVDLPSGHPGESLYIQGDEGWCGLMPAGGGHVQWWFDLPADEALSVPAHQRVAILRRRFGHWAAPVPEVVAQVDGSQIEPWPYAWHPVPRRLSVGRAVLIGDAAHAMPPSLAQGASQTLDDAWVLVDALRAYADLDAALRDYQRRRRWRAALVVRAARSKVALRGPSGPLLTVSRRIPAAVATAGFARWLRLVSDCL